MEIGNQQALFHERKNIAEELVSISLFKKYCAEKDYGAA